MDPNIRELLIGLGRLGARAAAAAVDAALEEGQELVGEISERLKRGRTKAQSIGKRPRKKVHVDVAKPGNEEVVGEVIDEQKE